jgi:hypothetical protein
MKDWKTTLGGVLVALGGPLAAAGEGWVQALGVVLSSAGALLLGLQAVDKKKAE